MTEETVVWFCISLREIFSNLIAFTPINKFGKGGKIQILTVFGPVPMFLSKSPLKPDFLDI